ncbi:putative S-adenosyl-L-methionine-dependent methyltransferase [Macleaya cordata]|uniref:Methyltransferase n=1 Tax=Macleaya cordata TaxID=56857 RepID=A0A200QYM5_MACCD|nr:putative S-adenosyl-L-methionine-dependent methyltransferase [Macleaya cordata]
MKTLNNGDFLKSPLLLKISACVLISFAFFYLGKHWSDSDGYHQLIFFNSRQSDKTPSVSFSPNANKTFDLSSLISNQTDNNQVSDQTLTLPLNSPSPTTSPENSEPSDPVPLPPPPPPPPLPPPPPPSLTRFGIVDENGTMALDFEVGEFDPDSVEENWGNGNETVEEDNGGSPRVRVKKFPLCPESMREYIPCLDNVEEIKKLNSTEKGEKYERHCPDASHSLNCLVPAPKDYKTPIPWPKSRDEVWFANVPHTRLVEDKGGQNWITIVKDKFKFPGGGTQFIHGADEYLNQISKMVSDIQFGRRTRVALDVGCGVASFGAFLLQRKVITLSIAPKDVHENQIQFALERGVPAMVAAFATHRLLYPSQAFELIHCSRCRINWTRDDGILLLEVNRLLRAGGYFVWAAQPVYKHEEALQEQWKEMEDLTNRLCWVLVKKEGYIAIWRKPLNNSCYESRDTGTQPPLCEPNDDPDKVWYTGLKACISRLPDNGYGSNVTTWPSRLHNPPDRLQSIQMDAYMSRKELFKADSKYWNELIGGYVRAFHWKKLKLRNVMDMRAGFGGFAAALINLDIDAWVLNVVPVSGPNTLPVLYDRGLIGVQHDWCEPFDTYPRTYDLLHAAELFSTERKRCNISTIMLEMDRILRPGGRAFIRDTLAVMDEIKEMANAMGWQSNMRDTPEGPHASRRLLMCEKRLLRA